MLKICIRARSNSSGARQIQISIEREYICGDTGVQTAETACLCCGDPVPRHRVRSTRLR